MKTEIFWIDNNIAILMRPRGGDWLADEIQSWLDEGLNVIVSLLTSAELAELDLSQEATVCQAKGVSFFWLPIDDLSVPPSMIETIKLIDSLENLLLEGKKIGIHCRQGLGRSPLIAACLLLRTGIDPEAAFDNIGASRGVKVPETEEQREWLNRFAEEMKTLSQ